MKNEYFREMLLIDDLEYLEEIKAKKVKMNDDFNEKLPRSKPKRVQAFTWQKAGTNGYYTDIPGRAEQIWCMFHPRNPRLAAWQIYESTGDMIFAEGCIEITDVLDMRNQAEKIAMLWASSASKKEEMS